jgi:hypothetical protein
MKGGLRFQPLQNLGGEKSSQTNEEKNRSTTLGLSRHGGEELDLAGGSGCRMDLPGPTTSVGTRTYYSVGPWDYSTRVTQHLMAWGATTTVEKYSHRKLCRSCTM